ncbi:MAG TPA: hypothetical protein VHO93_11560 [Actinomycetota bacterium]|jgi:hypothetical protein|nr:hypothetical protein [Actinomycetota bacterium]
MAEARIGTQGILGRVVRGLRRRPAARPRPSAVPPPADGLGAAEQAALEQLGAADGYATRWPVGREVARSLASRQLVVIAPDYVLLTAAGRRALTGDAGSRG